MFDIVARQHAPMGAGTGKSLPMFDTGKRTFVAWPISDYAPRGLGGRFVATVGDPGVAQLIEVSDRDQIADAAQPATLAARGSRRQSRDS